MTDEKLLERVRKLLGKAERAGTEHEAEAFTAKATELMLKYSIDEAMIQQAGGAKEEKVVVRKVEVKGYAKAKLELLRAVARGLGCDAAFYSNDRRGWSVGSAEVVGWESDMAAFEVLFASLQMQAASEAKRELGRLKAEWPALKEAWDDWSAARNTMEHGIWARNAKADVSRMHCPNCKADLRGRSWLDADKTKLSCANCGHTWTPLPHLSWSEKNAIRDEWGEANPQPENPGDEPPHGRAFMQSFLIGYAGVIGSRLRAQRAQAVKVADEERHGAALAVRDRGAAVKQVTDQRWTYGGSRQGARSSSNAGYYSGRDAGSRANIGSTSVGGGRRAIGGGR